MSGYMKNAFISMMIMMAIHSSVKNFLGVEQPVPCSAGVNDNTWLGHSYKTVSIFNPKSLHRTSQYLTMSDGVKLAVDYYTSSSIKPEDNIKLPTILHYTRHGRAYTLDYPFSLIAEHGDMINPRTSAYVRRFVSGAYVWVVVEVRGTGASYGTKKHDFSTQEREDGKEILDWIVQQPWSNGEVGLFGHGFDGVNSLLLASTQHPSLKALVLNGVPSDVFDGALFPGGVLNHRAVSKFTDFTHSLDNQLRYSDIPALKPRLMMHTFGGNVYPVNKDVDSLNEAVSQHKQNTNLTEALLNVKYRDDPLQNVPGVKFEDMDITKYFGDIAGSNIAIYNIAGYYDMAVARSSILLHQYLTNDLDPKIAAHLPPRPEHATTDYFKHRLTLGPWSPSNVDNCDPFADSKTKCFQSIEEINRFFDYHFFPSRQEYSGIPDEQPIHYFTLVENKWKSTDKWPSTGAESTDDEFDVKSLFLSNNSVLVDHESDIVPSEVLGNIDPESSSIPSSASRWGMIESMFTISPNYLQNREELSDMYVSFTSEEFSNPMELVGESELSFYYKLDSNNSYFVVYLEDVSPPPLYASRTYSKEKAMKSRGGVTYITEAIGHVRHSTISKDSSYHTFLRKDQLTVSKDNVQKITLRFQPIAYYLKLHHRIRITVVPVEKKDFLLSDAGSDPLATKFTIVSGPEYPSTLKLKGREIDANTYFFDQNSGTSDVESSASTEESTDEEVDEFQNDVKTEL